MNKLKLFLVDDDDDDRELFEYALKDVQHTVEFTFASGGRAALQKIQAYNLQPDFVFLDMNMPGMNGCECLQAMRKLPNLQHVPVIIYSSHNSAEYEQQARQLKANHFLVKPYRSAELTAVLNELLSGQKLPFLIRAMAGK